MIKDAISEMADLYEKGYSVSEIADKFGFDEDWVKENLKVWFEGEL